MAALRASARKASPELKERLLGRDAADPARDAEPLSVMIRCTSDVTDDQRAALADRGAAIGSCAGPIATATVPLGRLEDVLDLDFVAQVEGGRPMAPE